MQKIERKDKDEVWDEKKKTFGVFYGKKKKIKMWKKNKRIHKKKSIGDKIIREKTTKGTFNLMVQQLRLKNRKNYFRWVQERALCYSLQNFPTVWSHIQEK